MMQQLIDGVVDVIKTADLDRFSCRSDGYSVSICRYGSLWQVMKVWPRNSAARTFTSINDAVAWAYCPINKDEWPFALPVSDDSRIELYLDDE